MSEPIRKKTPQQKKNAQRSTLDHGEGTFGSLREAKAQKLKDEEGLKMMKALERKHQRRIKGYRLNERTIVVASAKNPTLHALQTRETYEGCRMPPKRYVSQKDKAELNEQRQ